MVWVTISTRYPHRYTQLHLGNIPSQTISVQTTGRATTWCSKLNRTDAKRLILSGYADESSMKIVDKTSKKERCITVWGYSWHFGSRSRFSNDHTDRFDITVIPCVFLTPVTSRNIKYINSTYPHTSSCSHHYVYDFHCPPYWNTNDATSVTACGCFTT